MKALIPVLLIALAGCATQPVPSSAAKMIPTDQVIDPTYLPDRPGTGSVTIKRDSGFLGGGCTTRVLVNASPVADLKHSEKIVLHLAPGDYVFSAQGTGLCKHADTAEVSSSITAGAAIAFRIGSPSGGGLVIYRTAF